MRALVGAQMPSNFVADAAPPAGRPGAPALAMCGPTAPTKEVQLAGRRGGVKTARYHPWAADAAVLRLQTTARVDLGAPGSVSNNRCV